MEQWMATEPDLSSTESKNPIHNPGLNTGMIETIKVGMILSMIRMYFLFNRTP